MSAAFLLVANDAAGGAEREQVEEARAALSRHGDVEPVWTRTPDDLDEVVRALAGRRLVAAGGDGSVHAVLGALLRHDAGVPSIAIVPLGTGNDLARTLGIPLEARDAADVAATGRERRLDLLVHGSGDIAVNAVHVGVGAEAAERSTAFKGVLGELAYPLGALLAGVRERGSRLTVEVDGSTVAGDAPVLMVAVMNGRSIGGGAVLCPGAHPDDGQLDVVVVSAVGPAARAAFAASLGNASHLDRDDVVHVRGRAVRIAGEPFRSNVDGEVSGPVRELDLSIRSGAWSVVVPPGG